MTTLTEHKPADYPRIPDALATFYIAVTTFIMCYSVRYTLFPILAFFALWLPHAFYKRQFILRPSYGLLMTLAFPLLCCYSAFWSDHPSRSIYYGTEYLAMALCVAIMSRTVSIQSYIYGIVAGTTLVLVTTLVAWLHFGDYATGSLVLLGSKNQSGMIAQICLFLALLAAFMGGSARQKLFYFLIPMAVCALCLIVSKSASAILSTLAVLCVTGVAALVAKMPQKSRLPAFIFLGFCGCTVLIGALAANIGIEEAVLKSFGKDATLTGRTLLWVGGLENSAERPALGYGYASFWVPGQYRAVPYWKALYPEGLAHGGFHFHSLYIEILVELGITGLVLFSSLLLYALMKSLLGISRYGITPLLAMSLGFSMMFIIRAIVEVDLIGPFGLGPLLFYAVIMRLAMPRITPNTPSQEKAIQI
jgi:exopolysaccharide production protein ExoQ